MRKSQTETILIRYLGLGLIVCSLGACSVKSSQGGTIRGSNGEADEEVGSNSGNSEAEYGKDPGDDENLPDVARNDPPVGSMDPDPDETITPPINQTGSPGKDKPNDPNQIVLNGYYFIKGAGSAKCLAIPGDSRENGVQIHQKTCDLKANTMKFEIEYLPSEKAYIISNIANQKYLEVRDQAEVIQGAVQQGDYFGLEHQMFLIEKKEGNRYHIRTKTKKLFFDVTGASTVDKALIQLWGDGNGISSQWIFEPTL